MRTSAKCVRDLSVLIRHQRAWYRISFCSSILAYPPPYLSGNLSSPPIKPHLHHPPFLSTQGVHEPRGTPANRNGRVRTTEVKEGKRKENGRFARWLYRPVGLFQGCGIPLAPGSALLGSSQRRAAGLHQQPSDRVNSMENGAWPEPCTERKRERLSPSLVPPFLPNPHPESRNEIYAMALLPREGLKKCFHPSHSPRFVPQS